MFVMLNSALPRDFINDGSGNLLQLKGHSEAQKTICNILGTREYESTFYTYLSNHFYFLQ